MDLDPAHSIEVITVSTSSSPGTSVKKVVPLQIDLERFPALDKDDNNKLRRPVRPIDRQRMRPWLMELLDLGNVFGLRWTNRHQGIFQISWRHASRLGWNLETDGDVFERWARHTGIYKEGDPPEPKRWKANFRCALHSLHDVVELTNAVERRGRNACRTYRFLQSNDEQSISRKRAKARRAKALLERPYEKVLREPAPPVVIESGGSSEEIVSDTESEESPQDKVIVQKLDIKPDISGEDYFLHHDHDYAGPDKTQKTILLRQGIGSIVLHRELVSAPDESDEEKQVLMSNLDQLASAAVSTASLESTPAAREPVKERKSSRLAKQGTSKSGNTPPHADIGESKKPEFSLKHLLGGTKLAEDDKSQSSRVGTRKRKSSASVMELSKESRSSDPVTLRKGERKKSAETRVTSIKTRASDLNKVQDQSPAQSPTNKRTSSPKILCRRSKRHRSKSEKSIVESTEPLMSSCLLLLEAATRLDNEEKKSTSSVSNTSNTNNEDQNSRKATVDQSMDSNDIQSDSDASDKKVEMEVEVSEEFVDDASEYQDGSLPIAESSSHENTPGLLRSTLEGTDRSTDDKDSVSKPKTIRNLLKDPTKLSLIKAISVSEGKLIVSDAPFAKGLFSGSTIQSNAQPPPSVKKKNKSNTKQVKVKQEIGNPTDLGGEADTDSKQTTFSVLDSQSLIPPSVSTIKSNSGVQQLVIQRALPVLSAPVQKSGITRLDAGASIMVTHGQVQMGNSPQVLITADANLSHTRTVDQQSINIIKGKTQVKPEQGSQSISLLRMDPAKQTSSSGSAAYPQLNVFKANDNVGSLVSVFSTPSLTKSTLSSTEVLMRNTGIKKTVNSIKITPASALRTVTFTASSGMPTFSPSQRVAAKTLPVHQHTFINIPVKSDIQTTLHSSALGQPATSLKTSSSHPPTVILGNSQPGKQPLNQVKFHVVPLTNASQIKSSVDITSVSGSSRMSDKSNPLDSLRNAGCSVHFPTEVVIDPSKGTFIKLADSSSLYQAFATNVSDSSVQLLKPPACTVASSVINAKSVTTSGITSKENSVVSTSMSSFFQPQSSVKVVSPKENMVPKSHNLKPGTDATPFTNPEHISSVNNSEETLQKTQDGETEKATGLNTASSISLLQSKSAEIPGDTSSIVLDFQQALQAHKMTQALANVAKFSVESDISSQASSGSANMKSLSELCKRYLANLFSTLDSQTSESDENESTNGSPNIGVKEDISSISLMNKLRSASQYKAENVTPTPASGDLTKDKNSALPENTKGETVVVTETISHFPSGEEPSLPEEPCLDMENFSSSAANVDVFHKSPTEMGNYHETVVSNMESASVSQESATAEQGEAQDDYNSKLLLDPTTPLAIGDIPLFATTKGETESFNPSN